MSTPTIIVNDAQPRSAVVVGTVPAAAVIVVNRIGTDGQDSDMLRATYDPTGVAADAFDLANHTGTIDTPAVTLDGGLL
jgi:glutamate formiminotransferase